MVGRLKVRGSKFFRSFAELRMTFLFGVDFMSGSLPHQTVLCAVLRAFASLCFPLPQHTALSTRQLVTLSGLEYTIAESPVGNTFCWKLAW